MKRVKSSIINFVIIFIIWVMLTWTLDLSSLIVGALVSFFVALANSRLFITSTHKWLEPKRYFYFLIYIFIFIKECVRANIDVALRVIKPTIPINPGIVKIKTRLKSEAAMTALANSITLTPGTFTVDIDAESGILYIHWIDVKDKDLVKATNFIAKRYEDILEKVFE